MMTTITDVLKKGIDAHSHGDLQAAVSSYQAALAMDEANATAHNNLGFVYAQLAQWQLAKMHLEKAIQLDKKLAVAYANLGQVQAATGNGEEGIKNLQKSVQLEPKNIDHWNNLARIYFAANEFENAEYAWHRALSLHPDSAEFTVKLATTMVSQKRFDEAHGLFDAAINLDPFYAQAWAQKGVLLLLEQNYGDCKKCLQQALNIAPSEYTALKHMALAHLACGETGKAIGVMRLLYQSFPGDHLVGSDLAVMELSIGEKEIARDRLCQLSETNRDSRILYYYAVSLKETHGDINLIKSLLEEVLHREDEYSEKAGQILQTIGISE